MCLRDANRPRDLTLGEVGVETQKYDPALTAVERTQTAGEQKPGFAFGHRLGFVRPADGSIARERRRVDDHVLRLERYLNVPSALAQVAADRAFDGGRHERPERDAAVGIEAR